MDKRVFCSPLSAAWDGLAGLEGIGMVTWSPTAVAELAASCRADQWVSLINDSKGNRVEGQEGAMAAWSQISNMSGLRMGWLPYCEQGRSKGLI